jgi:hypothetical protein
VINRRATERRRRSGRGRRGCATVGSSAGSLSKKLAKLAGVSCV